MGNNEAENRDRQAERNVDLKRTCQSLSCIVIMWRVVRYGQVIVMVSWNKLGTIRYEKHVVGKVNSI